MPLTSSERAKRQRGETSGYSLAAAFNTYLAVFDRCLLPSLAVFSCLKARLWRHNSTRRRVELRRRSVYSDADATQLN